MSVAIVILNYNGIELLRQFMPGIIQHSTYPQVSIYVIDNASTDGSVAFMQRNYPQVHLILNKQNYGFAGGYNHGLQSVNEDVLVLLNSDVEVTQGWLMPAVQYLQSNQNIAALQPKILGYHNKSHFDYAGAAGGLIDRDCFPFCYGRVFNVTEEDKEQYNRPTPIFWASGAALFIKNALFKQCRGFDADLFAHMEEIDLCWRLQNMGYTISSFPAAVVYHVGGATLSKSNPYKTYLNFRNNLVIMLKNLPAKNLSLKIFYRMFLDFLAWCHFISRGEFSFAMAVNKAHWHFIKSIGRHRIKRRLLNNKPLHMLHGVYHGSIIYRFFIKKATTAP